MSVATLNNALPARGSQLASTVTNGDPGVYFTAGRAPFQRELVVRRSDDPSDDSVLRTQFPTVLNPEQANGTSVDLDSFIVAAEALGAQPLNSQFSRAEDDQSQVRNLLNESGGALLFRNTPLRTADDFSRFAHALAKGGQWEYHVDKGLMVLRRVHAPNVATANEGPNTAAIGSHNEYGLSSHFPSYALFFCVSRPTSGGETPIASSLEIYDKLEQRAPDLVQALRDNGVRFTIHHPRDVIEGSLQGNGLLKPDAFGPSDGRSTEGLSEDGIRAIVEENVKALGIEGGWKPNVPADEAAKLPDWQRIGFTAEWLPDGSLLSHQRVPGVRPHPWVPRQTFFNNLHNRIGYSELHGAADPPYTSTWDKTKSGAPFFQYPPFLVGDKEVPLKPEWVEHLKQVTQEAQVDIVWQPGDVILLDNLSVQHARRPWEGPRKLLASFWDGPKSFP